MKIIRICNKIIEYSFYAIFLLIPLAIAGDTSELFEFNKMWLAFILGILIGTAWIIKSIVKKEFRVQKTPLDIPILLFLFSQILSTLFSWDRHISLWGYYSRFNGGLLSTILYIFFYYAFVSNLISRGDTKEKTGLPAEALAKAGPRTVVDVVKRFLNLSIITAVLVSLWGLPSHFGYDPTCLVFRGNLDVSCWAADFQPRVRIFSTLGQPDWLAAYLAILLPVSIALFLENYNLKEKFKLNRTAIFYFTSSILFYIDLLYARSKSAIIAVGISLSILFITYFYLKRKELKIINFVAPLFIILLVTFYVGLPFSIFSKFSYSEVMNKVNPTPAVKTQTKTEKPAPAHIGELGGTDSGKIRLLVWKGAIEAWKNNPIFGTGVETFAFAYYKYKSPAHNLTSEWNFLYNKAHNEFLNYLATTGTFGITTYLLMIGWFLYLPLKRILNSIRKKEQDNNLLSVSLISGYITILITNFFGFSVVIVNIYLFIIPAFVLVLENMINSERELFIFKDKGNKSNSINPQLSPFQWMGTIITVVIGFYFLFTLLSYWNADKAYTYGYNLDRVGMYQDAYNYLHKAVLKRGDEPVFRDEMAINDAVLAAQLVGQKDNQNASASATTASTLSREAITTSNDIVSSYPNNFVFWKTRIRIFYTLAQVDPQFLPSALSAVEKAAELSPNDASIIYNLGVIEGQSGNIDKAIEVLERAVKLKPDYKDAHYALGLFYNQKAIDKSGNVIKRELLNKAIGQMKYILTYINSSDTQAKEALKTLEKK